MDADEWIAKNLGYEVRAQRVEKSLNESISGLEELGKSGGNPDGASTRAALQKRLATLRDSARELALLAPNDDYLGFTRQLDAVSKPLTRRDWRAAHIAITQAEKSLALLLPASRAWAALRTRADQAATALGLQVLLFTDEESKALKGSLALLRTALSQGLAPDALKQAGDLADGFDEAFKQQLEAATQRHSRIELLHIERQLLAQRVNALRKRAKAAEVNDVTTAAQNARVTLENLAGSRDEAAMTNALAGARTAYDQDWLPPLLVKEREIDLQLRRERLAEVERQRDALLLQHRGALKSALLQMQGDVAEARDKLDNLLKAADPDQAEAAERALSDLEDAFARLQDDMKPIVRQQVRLRRMLGEYDGFTEEQQKQNPEAWKALEFAYADLPEDFTENDPDSTEWATSDDWFGFELGTFFAKFAAFNAKAKTADRRQAYVDAAEERDTLDADYKAVRAHATTVHQTAATLAFDALNKLLERKPEDLPTAELNDTEQQQASERCEELATLIGAIEEHRDKRRGDAKQIDVKDGGHSVARHGPEVPLEKISKRVTTGYSPDGKWSPFKKSGQFLNYDLQIETREAAFTYAEAHRGADFGPNRDKPPVGAALPFIVTVPHGKQVGRGFEGTGAPVTVPGKNGEVYTTVVATVLTSSYTKIIWDADKLRWVAIQHFPS